MQKSGSIIKSSPMQHKEDISSLRGELNSRITLASGIVSIAFAAVYIPLDPGPVYIYAVVSCALMILLCAAYFVYMYKNKNDSSRFGDGLFFAFYALLGLFMLPLHFFGGDMRLAVPLFMAFLMLTAPYLRMNARLVMLALYLGLNAAVSLIIGAVPLRYLYIALFAGVCFLSAGFIHSGYGLMINRLLKDAQTDALTGLMNRGTGFSRLENALAACRRLGSDFCIMMVDVDDFKKLNDCLGHTEGDSALTCIAHSISGCFCRGTDVAFRYGGEEFVIGMPTSCAEETRRAACALMDSIRGLNICCGAQGRLSVSIGAYTIPCSDKSMTAEDAIRLADDAMYEAKARGKDIAVFAP